MVGAGYKTGVLAPFKSHTQSDGSVRLPFASANYGQKPANANDWSMSGANQPLGQGRNLTDMARSFMSSESNADSSRLGDNQENVDPRRARGMFLN